MICRACRRALSRTSASPVPVSVTSRAPRLLSSFVVAALPPARLQPRNLPTSSYQSTSRSPRRYSSSSSSSADAPNRAPGEQPKPQPQPHPQRPGPPPPLEKPDYLDAAESAVWDRLAAALSPTELSVRDVSGGCGSMYSVDVVSEAFRGVSVLKQQRMVNGVLADLVAGWHGIQLRTRAP